MLRDGGRGLGSEPRDYGGSVVPMSARQNDQVNRPPSGSLTIVGSGIVAVAHLSPEAAAHIASADIVFYHATNGVTASHIRQLNPNAVDLYRYYDEGKPRRETYIQMAELMLREVRRNQSVVGVFHGHPGYFVLPARRALAIASSEGFRTALLPAISATDCLFADLRVDPGVRGCQILNASHVFLDDTVIATSCHLVFLQVGPAGDHGFSFSRYKNSGFPRFIERLIEIYGEDQDSVHYRARIFPSTNSRYKVRMLGEYRVQVVQSRVRSGMLYLPPKGVAFSSLTSLQAFGGHKPYRTREKEAIQALDLYQTPSGFRSRASSDPFLEAMTQLATNLELQEELKDDPERFLRRFPDLTPDEKRALSSGKSGLTRQVTTKGGD
jgi:hypothetical protein